MHTCMLIHTLRVPVLITLVIVVTAGSRDQFVDVSFLFGLAQVQLQYVHRVRMFAFTILTVSTAMILCLASYDSSWSVSLSFNEVDENG